MVARSVRCRASTSARPPPSRSRERSSRSRRSLRDRVERRPAASSMASGMPSSRRTMSATIRRSDSDGGDPRRTRRARSTNTATEGISRRSPSDPGKGRGASRELYSVGRPSGSRLVVRIDRRGQPARIRPTVSRTASSRCSQLSITSIPGSSPRTATQADRTSPWATLRFEGLGQGVREAGGVGHRGEEQHRRRLTPAGDLEGDAGLADPTGSDDGHQPLRGEQSVQ